MLQGSNGGTRPNLCALKFSMQLQGKRTKQNSLVSDFCNAWRLLVPSIRVLETVDMMTYQSSIENADTPSQAHPILQR